MYFVLMAFYVDSGGGGGVLPGYVGQQPGQFSSVLFSLSDLRLSRLAEEEEGWQGWPRGAELFTHIKPWVAIVSRAKETSCCPGCFRPGRAPDPDIDCRDCGLVSYCSWACRARDDLHHLECRHLARAGRLPVRDEVRVMVRALGKLLDSADDRGDLLAGGGEGDKVPGRKDLRRFSELLSHKEDFLKSKQKTEDIKLLYDETEEFLDDEMPSFTTFLEVLGRLYINGFEMCDSAMETYGWAVYLGPSVLDHSCQPNCLVTFSGPRLTVSTMQKIPSLAEARISYLNPKLPTQLRQQKLLENYYFSCICPKCSHSHHKGTKVDNHKNCSKNGKKRNK